MLCCKRTVLTDVVFDMSDIIICRETENNKKIKKFNGGIRACSHCYNLSILALSSYFSAVKTELF